MLFDVKDVDTRFYEERLKGSLPKQIIDIHTHVYKLGEFGNVQSSAHEASQPAEKRLVTWPALVASVNPIEDLFETYRLMFPDNQVTPLIFSNVKPENDIDELNDYIDKTAALHNLPALLYAHPSWTEEELSAKLNAGNFLGVKVYLNLAPAYIPGAEIRIFDFLPPHHLNVLDRLGLLVMLHIPRAGRLKDPVNLAQILEIEERYPNIRLILAHVGRAYCREDVGNAFDVLGATKNLVFDFCANTNSWVFAKALEAVGPKRMLFGSDMPITRMRMKRICENGTYINLVPKGLYGDVSGDKNMREVEGKEADSLTFFLYEEIAAFLDAARQVGLTSRDLEDAFYNNARRILESVGYRFAHR